MNFPAHLLSVIKAKLCLTASASKWKYVCYRTEFQQLRQYFNLLSYRLTSESSQKRPGVLSKPFFAILFDTPTSAATKMFPVYHDCGTTGKGERKNKTDALTPSEEEQLWTRKALDGDMSRSISRTVYFTISQHFGTSGCKKHHQMQVQDLKFICDSQTEQILNGLSIPQKHIREVSQRCPKTCLPQEMRGVL